MRRLLAGTRARVILLLAAVVSAALMVGAIAVRQITVYPSVEQFTRMLDSQVSLAHSLFERDAARAPEALAAAGLLLTQDPPPDRPLPNLKLARMTSAKVKGRYGADAVHFQPGPQGVVWIRLQVPGAPWLGMRVETVRPAVWGAAFWTLASTSAIVLIAAFLLARSLTRPLERLSAAAPALLAGEAAAVDRAGFSREVAALADALGDAARVRLAALAARERVLAEVSHDLRTPLARLKFALELGDGGDANARAEMSRDVDELEAIVSEALAWLRDGRDEAVSALDLGALVADVVQAFRRREPAISLVLPEHAPYRGKPVALKRALSNLLDNALVHGAPPIVVTLAARDTGYSLRVEDQGPGPAPASEGARRDRYGLGLSIVRAVAAAHGGGVTAIVGDSGHAAEMTLG